MDCSVTMAWCFRDAAYLELAIREGISLATVDKNLRKAARRMGVALVGKK